MMNVSFGFLLNAGFAAVQNDLVTQHLRTTRQPVHPEVSPVIPGGLHGIRTARLSAVRSLGMKNTSLDQRDEFVTSRHSPSRAVETDELTLRVKREVEHPERQMQLVGDD